MTAALLLLYCCFTAALLLLYFIETLQNEGEEARLRWNKLDGHLESFHTLHKRWLPTAHPVLGQLLNLKRPPLLVGRWYGTGRIGADGEEYLEEEDVRHLASMRAAEGRPPLSRQVALLLLYC